MARDVYTYREKFNVLPKLPNAMLGRSWQTYCRHRKQIQKIIAEVIYPNRPCQPFRLASLVFTRYSSREPDFDNLVSSFKPVMDALVQCGYIIDDKPSVVGSPSYYWIKAPQKEGAISFEITEKIVENIGN